jgi:pimeloyl-ACP methyl ester carboxylesterase
VVNVSQSWTSLPGRRVHAWEANGRSRGDALVVLLPGLGLPAYAAPTVRALATRGATAVLLDLPGFGERARLGAHPSIDSIGRAAAAWILRRRHRGRLVLVGHSTGAQAALTAALAIQSERPDAELVLAGPTFAPPHRRLLSLISSAPLAYREDSLRELRVLPALARGRLDVWSMLRSGMRDAPERRITALRLGVTLTAGSADAFAPQWWLSLLAASASRAAYAVSIETQGSHNNLFTHPAELADIVLGSADPRTRRP